MPKVIDHVDKIGQPLVEGNHVAVAWHNIMYICQVVRFTPKRIFVRPITEGWDESGFLVYKEQLVLLSGPDAVIYILKYTRS